MNNIIKIMPRSLSKVFAHSITLGTAFSVICPSVESNHESKQATDEAYVLKHERL
jgi:hypothetical protein